jgi:hypothetical protein
VRRQAREAALDAPSGAAQAAGPPLGEGGAVRTVRREAGCGSVEHQRHATVVIGASRPGG